MKQEGTLYNANHVAQVQKFHCESIQKMSAAVWEGVLYRGERVSGVKHKHGKSA